MVFKMICIRLQLVGDMVFIGDLSLFGVYFSNLYMVFEKQICWVCLLNCQKFMLLDWSRGLKLVMGGGIVGVIFVFG